jgi:transposase
MEIAVIGLDLAKYVFQVHGVDAAGQAVLRRKLRRGEVLAFFAKLPRALVGIEACHTAHYWGRELAKLGHEVRLMPPQFVKPYVKSQKNDAVDAEAICEAVQRPNMRFVPVKSADEQAVILRHRTRDLLIRQRSSLVSAIRAHFAEFGITVGQGIRNIERLLALLQTEGGERRMPAIATEMLGILQTQSKGRSPQSQSPAIGSALVGMQRHEPTAAHLTAIRAPPCVAVVGNTAADSLTLTSPGRRG